jgi:hypothetical protein
MADRSPALIVFDSEGLEARAAVAIRHKPSQLVAGGRYELYSNYALEIQAVAASVMATP